MSGAGPVVRDAAPHDLPRLAALERALFAAEAWDEASLRAELDGPGRRLLVLDGAARAVGAAGAGEGGEAGEAGRAGEVAAYAATMVLGDVADLLRIGVDPAHQGRGLARALLGAVLAHAREAGAERLLLEVAATNRAALALYRGAGLRELDRRPRYYRDGADALVLGLSLA